VATAQERRSNSFRTGWRLEDALACSNEAVRIYRDLGARWELASALGDRGTLHRLLDRSEEAERDLREAWALCVELGDRVLIAWTVSELAIVLALDGRVEEATEVLDAGGEPESLDAPSDRTARLWARTFIDLAQGDEDAARRHAVDALEIERLRGREVSVAVATWWVGSLFGAEAAGGEDQVERARRRIEAAGWVRAFREVERVRGTLAAVR
jgi:tetratricopeptide (TPR) repeat protein